jgi:hypothetical protein
MMSDEFDFNLNAPVTRLTDGDILRSLKEFAAEKGGEPFTTSDYDSWPERVCCSDTVSKRIGSWRKALASVGINRGVQAHTYEVLELMDNLEKVWRELRRPPGKRVLREYGTGISERPYVNQWGSVRAACEVLARFKRGELSEDELLQRPPGQARQTIPLKTRWKVLKRDDYLCVKCGRRPPDVQLEVDHIRPVAKGGGNGIENLRTLCHDCNQGRKDRE